MSTIELDIIKQRSDKLLPSEKRELIEYLAASLSDEEKGHDHEDKAVENLRDEETD
ncbi:MAG: hypothetical protein ACKVRN_09170 [Pyrinomonadaceae bacterium]